MSEQKSKETPVVPELKIEIVEDGEETKVPHVHDEKAEDDKSKIVFPYVQEKIRKLSTSSKESVISPIFKMSTTADLKAIVDVKEKEVQQALDELNVAIVAKPADKFEVEMGLSYLRRTLEVFNEAQGKFMNGLVKEKRTEDLVAESKKASNFLKERIKVELKSQHIIGDGMSIVLSKNAGVDTSREVVALKIKRDFIEADMVRIEQMINYPASVNPLEFRSSVASLNGQMKDYVARYEKFADALLTEDEDEYKVATERHLKFLKRKNTIDCNYEDIYPESAPVMHIGKDPQRMDLPKRELPKFNGDVRNWLSFWAAFEEIHKDKSLTEAHKFEYLIQGTEKDSPARKLIMSFPTSAANYQPAVHSLKERYGRDNVLVKVYVRDLLKLVVDNSSGKRTEFVELVTQITSQIRNLETLGVTKDKCAEILYPVVESCLPVETLTAWQRHSSFKEELDALIDFLNIEVNSKLERKLAQSQFAPAQAANSTNNNDSKKYSGNKKKDVPTASTLHTQSSNQTICCFCDRKGHNSAECRTARRMTAQDKRDLLKAKNLCYICFEKHMARNCPNQNTVKCSNCQGKHLDVMCWSWKSTSNNNTTNNNSQQRNQQATSTNQSLQQQTEVIPAQPVANQIVETSNQCSNTVLSPEVPLQTLAVLIHGADGKKKIVRALLDSGSQKSYILEDLARDLNLRKMGEKEIKHQLFGGVQTSPQKHLIVKLTISDTKDHGKDQFDVCCVQNIASNIATPAPGPWIEEFGKKGIYFPDFSSSSKNIDVLIGNDVLPRMYTGKIECLNYGPAAMETVWGWVLAGKLPIENKSNGDSMFVSSLHVTDKPLSDLWALDTIGIEDATTNETREIIEKATQQHFEKNLKQSTDGRYEVALPWISDIKERLPSNYYVALRRLKSMTKGLHDNGYLETYDKLFEQWKIDGMIEKVPSLELLDSAHYLPHRAVVKLSSSTTPVRPVFDASAKIKGSPSLNDCLDKGPNLLKLVPAIITRFRMYQTGMTADVKKAFQQINVKQEDRNYLRFLWWNNISCETVKVFRHNRVVFGVTCSPFLLGATLNSHLQKTEDSYAATAQLLMKSFYVDNCVASVAQMKDALQFRRQAEELLLPAHFDLRGWEFGPGNEEKQVPILGLLWNTKEDYLKIDVNSALAKMESVGTQRKVLSLAHSVYDPMGFVSPFTLKAKLILRKCYEQKLGWDTPLPQELQEEFDKWQSEIPSLNDVLIPRYTHYGTGKDLGLHVFCDASQEAYAAAVYLRVEDNDSKVEVHLMQSKARVAPKMKKITIPRLELIACTIGCRLVRSVMKDLEVEDIPINMWTDSTTALFWIHGDGPWGEFVKNRRDEIRRLTDPSWWHHVPGDSNPADLPSRGATVKKLLQLQWWRGVEWLHQSRQHWPNSQQDPNLAEINEEKRKTIVSTLTTEDTHPISAIIEKISEYPKMVKTLAYWNKFIDWFQARVRKESNLILSKPTIEEIEKAEVKLLRYTQRKFEEQPKRIKSLKLSTDENGLVRLTTRLLHDDEENFKRPILLPDKDEVVNRLIRWEHLKNSHAGTQVLLSHLRENFWIINGRRTVRRVISSCWRCRRYEAKRLEVPEAPLPLTRTRLGIPFHVTGMDAAGPLMLKGKEKVWIIIFTCASYRALHLEVVNSLSTDAFFCAFRRFVSRRGRPSIVYSDNGLNFVGASRILGRIDWKKVEEYGVTSRIAFRRTVPTGAWWGGFWERLIGLVKSRLYRTLGKEVVRLDELHTLLCEIEDVLNNRPLTYSSDDPDDPIALTPNHFVRNSGMAYLPEVDTRDAQSLRSALRKMQNLRDELRSRLRLEYLGELKSKANSRMQTLKEGDVIIIETDNAKRLDWPLGVILEVYPGRDNLPRMYKVKTKAGELLRPAQRLYPMEVQEGLQ